MRALWLVLVFVVANSGVHQAAEPPERSTHAQAALDLLELMHVERTVMDAVDIMLKAQMSGNPSLVPFEDIMRAFLMKHLSWESVGDDYIGIYTNAFTEAELRELVGFYRTELGQKVISTLPALMQQGAALGQAKVQEHKDELTHLITKRVRELEASKPSE